MRRIKIEKWVAQARDGSNHEEDLLLALTTLVNAQPPERMPKGLDKFRLFGKINKAFEEARVSRELTLEEYEYSFLKKCVEEDVPAVWGTNKDVNNAIEAFLAAKQE
jgi:hypothetical protein